MLVGIDIGGTFTDGVLLKDGRIVKSAKYPTDETNLESSIITVLDELIKNVEKKDIKRGTLSTTLVTNLLARGFGDKTALILIPGPGLNLKTMELFPHTFIIDGATDFRGRIIEPINTEQIKRTGRLIQEAGIKKVAVVGKFSPRNSEQEEKVREILLRDYPQLDFTLGFETAGQLNFLRRIATTYYTAMTLEKWQAFAKNILKALESRMINCPLNILKADGGTMPLEVSLNHPCETVFSGPAASVMGAYALTRDQETSVVMDIGGTTADLALILKGKPLYASKGARIGEHYTSIRAFSVRSVALGGDSVIRGVGSDITIGPDRMGVAACFGGPAATPTDAINILEDGKLGGLELSREALEKIARPLGMTVQELARLVVEKVNHILKESIKKMFETWEKEPLYKVYEVVNKRSVKIDKIIGIGGAAQSFVPAVANSMGCSFMVHEYSQVANALGAAVSRPTLTLVLHADTGQGHFHLNLDGIAGKIPAKFSLEDAKKMAREYLQELMVKRSMAEYTDQYEYFMEEQFNTISGFMTIGKIFDVGIQVAPGVINELADVVVGRK
ncbi:MAG: hydantoinase/oxoprolinase family protein [Clostridia bacterium]|nr:hydantoinase/oxoprolinase family protein [Clostridia bacterium]